MNPKKTFIFTQKMPIIELKSSNFKNNLRVSTPNIVMPKIKSISTRNDKKKYESKKNFFHCSCEKEELYERTILLKKELNNLHSELTVTKSELMKTELNLKKKKKRENYIIKKQLLMIISILIKL